MSIILKTEIKSSWEQIKHFFMEINIFALEFLKNVKL